MFEKKEGIDYISNFYRSKLYDKESNLYLLTTDDGAYIFLNSSAYKQLKKGKIVDEEIYSKLLVKGIIVNEENFNYLVAKTAQRYSFLGNGTSLHIVVPTHRCNLACTYCFASAAKIDDPVEKTDLKEETAMKIVEFILSSPSKAITIEFQGGEATVRFDLLQKMTNYARELNKTKKKDLKVTVVTNLTLMTKEKANWLVENDVTICTSFDGPEIVHNKNRYIHGKEGKEIGTYKQVSHWINEINRLCKEKNKSWTVNALMTITKHSLPYYKEIIDEYLKHDINFVDIRALTYVGRAVEDTPDIFYSEKEFVKFYENSLNYIKELAKKGIHVTERIKELYEIKVLENKPTYHADFESPCGAATGQITYFSDGNIYTCNEALGREEFKIGNVFKDKWKDIFKKEETAKLVLNSMLEQNVKCDRCTYKPYCGTCMVENYYHFGKFNFYPSKTSKHHETIYQCEQVFNPIVNEIKKSI